MKKILFAVAVVLGLASCSAPKNDNGAQTSENTILLIRNATLKLDYA